MSILMPALAKVKKQAKAVVCLSNHGQWGKVFLMYAGDNDSSFTGEWLSIAQSNGGHDIWVEALRPYYKNDKLLLCPSATRTAEEGAASPYKAWGVFPSDTPYGGVAGKRGSYMINWWATNPYDYPAHSFYKHSFYTPRLWKTIDVKSPQKIPVLGAGGAVWRASPDSTDNLPEFDGDESWGTGCSMPRFSLNRHELGYTHVLFMDWSVRKVGLKELWTLKWHRLYDTRNRHTLAGGAVSAEWPEWMRGFKDY